MVDEARFLQEKDRLNRTVQSLNKLNKHMVEQTESCTELFVNHKETISNLSNLVVELSWRIKAIEDGLGLDKRDALAVMDAEHARLKREKAEHDG